MQPFLAASASATSPHASKLVPGGSATSTTSSFKQQQQQPQARRQPSVASMVGAAMTPHNRGLGGSRGGGADARDTVPLSHRSNTGDATLLALKRLDTQGIRSFKRNQISSDRPRTAPVEAANREDVPPDADILDPLFRIVDPIAISPLRLIGFPFIGVLLCWALLFICLAVDRSLEKWYIGDKPVWYNYTPMALTWTLFNSGYNQSFSLWQGLIPATNMIFGIVITISFVSIQNTMEKTSPVVFRHFYTAKFVIIYFAFLFVLNVLVFWCGLETGGPVGIKLDVDVEGLEIFFLFPFLIKAMGILDPNQVVSNLVEKGLNTVIESINLTTYGNSRKHQELQQSTTKTIDCLLEGTHASSEKDANKVFCSIVVDALCSFGMHYANIKSKASKQWFEIPTWLRRSPDFYLLNDDSIQELVQRETWVEWKLMRQYQHLYSQGLMTFHNDLCYHICISTRILGLAFAHEGHVTGLDLAIKFFNTYLRAGINFGDIKVVYNTLFQYRVLGERLLTRHRDIELSTAVRAVKIAKYALYYADQCRARGGAFLFLVETVAQDLRVLCETAYFSYSLPQFATSESMNQNRTKKYSEIHSKLLEIFLKLGDMPCRDVRGVLRAQVILATFYLHHKQQDPARQISSKLRRTEFTPTLYSIYYELSTGTTKEFWEVSERGYNFAYMDKRLANYLNEFYGWFEWFTPNEGDKDSGFWSTAEGKKLKVQQELTNFDESDDEEDNQDGAGLL
ncbi:hypothetical protein Pelo_14561 [Pelomyxa schiedti]|nr:hypothetical protein Pelo_14561 [Pelomyxa schiedti]